MKSYFGIVASVALVFFATNTLAHDSFDNQNACDVKYHLHENLAKVLETDTGVQVLSELRENMKKICLDPKAHDGVVGLLDAITELTTNPNVSLTLANLFYWTRKVIKDQNFRAVWHETMKGINMLFDNHVVCRLTSETLFDNLTTTLNSPYFDFTFEKVLKNVSTALNLRKSLTYGILAKVGGGGGGGGGYPSSARTR